MSNSIKPAALGAEIARQLSVYSEDVTERINAVGQKSIEELVRRTKAAAPKRSGRFRRNITSSELPAGNGMKRYIWHVKAPDYRLVHLLVHGHATKDGGRTTPDPFLTNALNKVLPDYEKSVEEELKND